MNVKLAKRVLDYIEVLPESLLGDEIKGDTWKQSTYFQQTDCGTACCFAGWTVILAKNIKKGRRSAYMNEIWVSEVAGRLLDLSDRQASRLFSEYNNLNDLKELVKEMS